MAAKTIHNMFGYMNKQISRKGGNNSNFDVYTVSLLYYIFILVLLILDFSLP
jgi:hypothetical protein